MKNLLIFLIILLTYQEATAFTEQRQTFATRGRGIHVGQSSDFIVKRSVKNNSEEEEQVKLGSKEYYSGFLQRGMNEEPIERVSGDALLGPILKFSAGSFVVIVVFLLGFMASNGLLSF